jgi:hypothetical protein
MVDGDLDIPDLGSTRGSGVDRRDASGTWKIVHYHLAITVPSGAGSSTTFVSCVIARMHAIGRRIGRGRRPVDAFEYRGRYMQESCPLGPMHESFK